jgi:hypothetical protein
MLTLKVTEKRLLKTSRHRKFCGGKVSLQNKLMDYVTAPTYHKALASTPPYSNELWGHVTYTSTQLPSPAEAGIKSHQISISILRITIAAYAIQYREE